MMYLQLKNIYSQRNRDNNTAIHDNKNRQGRIRQTHT